MGNSHVFAITVTSGERAQLLRLIGSHGTPAQRKHLGHLVEGAVDMGSVAALARSVSTPGRQAGSRSAPIDAGNGRSARTGLGARLERP